MTSPRQSVERDAVSPLMRECGSSGSGKLWHTMHPSAMELMVVTGMREESDYGRQAGRTGTPSVR